MNVQLQSKLDKLRADYTQVTGQPFNDFFCPILFRDEKAKLCEGHIVNKAFPGSSRKWTVQRADVDSFYGSNFEADFVKLQLDNKSPVEILFDNTLSQKLRPDIFINGKLMDYYIARKGDVIPPNFFPYPMEYNGDEIICVFKVSPQDFVELTGGNEEYTLTIETSKDLRLSAAVSLIKAAHLTLFETFGYSYALSPAGRLIGRDILGEFYLQNRAVTKKSEVLENAYEFFNEYAHMIRPVQQNYLNLQGSIDDNKFFVCKGFSYGARPWAYIVTIKTSETRHCVMMPIFEELDAISTFLGFLKNSNESVEVNPYKFEQDHWEVNPNSFTLTWPKTGTLYP